MHSSLLKVAYAVCILFALLSGRASAQFTVVSGTIVDPNGLPYALGTITPLLVLPGGISPTLNGLPYSPPTQRIGLDSNGSFIMNLADSSVLLPANTKWNFTVCSGAGTVQASIGKGPVCFSLATPITISGASQDISTNLNALALSLTRPAGLPFYTSANGSNVGLGVPTAGYNGNAPSLLSLIRGILEIHNNGAAQAIDLYVHNDAGFRSPYINFYKSRGTQLAPTPVTYTGVYEADSVGGINFGGWDGSAYGVGAAIYTNNDENWTPTAHGAHLSIYGTFSGVLTQKQIMQFGGKDPQGIGSPGGSIISYRPISFGGNTPSSPAIYYTLNPPAFHVRTADDSADAPLSVSSLTLGTTTVGALPPASVQNIGQVIRVSDSRAITAEGQVCASGGTDTALAFSNGTVWKCF